MNAIIPDTLTGALILSVIDFFLSFVIIAGIGVVLSFFPLLNRLAKHGEHDGHSHSKKHHHAHGRHPQPDAVVAPAMSIGQEHVAAISAAVHSVMGPHQIVHMERADK